MQGYYCYSSYSINYFIKGNYMTLSKTETIAIMHEAVANLKAATHDIDMWKAIRIFHSLSKEWRQLNPQERREFYLKYRDCEDCDEELYIIDELNFRERLSNQ